MSKSLRISLVVPSSKNVQRSLSLRIKKEMWDEPSSFIQPAKVLAVSDIRGNFMQFRRLLIKCGVIDNKYKWTFHDGHLVVTGDCFSQGHQAIECLWLIYSLEEKARSEGGYVHFILGNQEINNLNGDWRHVHPRYALQMDKQGTPLAALYDGNSELWRWLQTKNVVEKIGHVLFVHGGIAKELLSYDLTIGEINRLTRQYLTRTDQPLVDDKEIFLFRSSLSPFCFDGYYEKDIPEADIEAVLCHFGATTIVTGHSTVERVTVFYNGKVININSNAQNESMEALYIKGDRFYRVDQDGKQQRIK